MSYKQFYYTDTDGTKKPVPMAILDPDKLQAKADKATTLEGYGITDGATSSEVTQLALDVRTLQEAIEGVEDDANAIIG